jgi:chemotaxis protein methyltransferase CheR
MNADKKEDIEIELLIEAIKKTQGVDFSHYKLASFKRRLYYHLEKSKLTYISELISKIIWHQGYFEHFLFDISIPVTEMYRDPDVYAFLSQKIFPFLKTFPKPRIWIAGCATGEEAYSLAILLTEYYGEQAFQIIASDFNAKAIDSAKKGFYDITILESKLAYKKAGGKYDLSQYFINHGEKIEIIPKIKNQVLFLEHDLTSDIGMSNIHLILCRNVFIYFDKSLQKSVTELFYQSLCAGGFLCLGLKESLEFLPHNRFKPYEKSLRIYRKPYQR